MERCVPVWTQRMLQVRRVFDSLSHVPKANTEQDQSIHVMILRQSVNQHNLCFTDCCYVLLSTTAVVLLCVWFFARSHCARTGANIWLVNAKPQVERIYRTGCIPFHHCRVCPVS